MIEENLINYKEVDDLYNEFMKKTEEALSYKHLEVETLQFLTGARCALIELKKRHDEKYQELIKANDPLKRRFEWETELKDKFFGSKN